MALRILNLLVSLDQFLFSLITLGGSNPDETMSAAAYRLEKANRWQGKFFRPIIDLVFFFDKEHCKTSYMNETYK